MARPRSPSRREPRKRPRRASAPASTAPEPARRSRPHPTFGPIPLVPKSGVGLHGAPTVYWVFDLDWQPPLPRGAVRGEPRRQTYCCDPPRYYYVDQDRTCVQCGASFVFAATEQKHWYETLGFRLDATAVRCPPCRRRRRSDHAVGQALGLAVTEVAARPEDPSTLVALARATVAHVERFGSGNLDRALAACRKAAKLAPDLALTRYWEGRVQEAAGRAIKAIAAYASFLGSAEGDARARPLRKDAEVRRLALIAAPAIAGPA